MATGERKQGAFGVGCSREKRGPWVWDTKWTVFGGNFSKQGIIQSKLGQL